ncbi:MAG TPA: cupin domain-containing protein, partial [Thermomonas sp.]
RARRGGPAAARLYAGGTAHALEADDARRLAAADTVDATLYAGLAEAGKATVVALLAAGHYRLDEEDAP